MQLLWLGTSLRIEVDLAKLFLSGKIGWNEFYVASHPYTSMSVITAAYCIIVFISCYAGPKKFDFTLTDKIWPFVTLFSLSYYAVHNYVTDTVPIRLLVVFPALLLWSYHLTKTFADRGGFRGIDDHRWIAAKSSMNNHPVRLFVFSIFYVTLFQPMLLVNNASPGIYIAAAGSTPMGSSDWMLAMAIYAVVLAEYFIDELYQQDFQIAKRTYQATGIIKKPYMKAQIERGFCTRGPFAYSRHPNVVFEQLIWYMLYLWGATCSGCPLNWTLIAPLAFTALCLGSFDLTEKISAKKYPAYEEYQQKVGFMIPIPGRVWVEPLIVDKKIVKSEAFTTQ
ncbi:uncharacterized protein V1518DRAFT_411900 [Limtongia smithiae]|uniref:uncharacterized protein n=1 Tax=Limtongia smithiae TaxID=1125753 RepID=UPI0034CF1008